MINKWTPSGNTLLFRILALGNNLLTAMTHTDRLSNMFIYVYNSISIDKYWSPTCSVALNNPPKFHYITLSLWFMLNVKWPLNVCYFKPSSSKISAWRFLKMSYKWNILLFISNWSALITQSFITQPWYIHTHTLPDTTFLTIFTTDILTCQVPQ